MEAKQYATKKPVSNNEMKKRKLQNTLRQMTMKTTYKIYGMQQKQF